MMELGTKEKLLMSMRSPYLWMVRGVIALAGLLYSPWMLLLLPVSEVVIQTWFGAIFKERLDAVDRQALLARTQSLSREDNAWYARLEKCVADVRGRLSADQCRQLNFDALVQDVYQRLTTLRGMQQVLHEMPEDSLKTTIAEVEKSLKKEDDDRVRETLSTRLDIQKQRLELRQKLAARARELDAQLNLVEDQVQLLRDTVVSTGDRTASQADTGVTEKLDVLSRQLRICADLEDDMRSIVKKTPTMEARA